MKIFVKARTNSKEEKVVPPPTRLWREDSGVKDYFVVSVKEPPKEGKANDAILKLLAKHFGVTRSSVRLVSGSTSKTKVFEILGV